MPGNSHELNVARGRLGHAIRHQAAPEVIAQRRRECKREAVANWIANQLAQAPDFTAADWDHIMGRIRPLLPSS